jgi:hypothetical protein
VEQDTQREATDLPDGASEIFAREGVDGAKRLDGSSKISFCAHTNFWTAAVTNFVMPGIHLG